MDLQDFCRDLIIAHGRNAIDEKSLPIGQQTPWRPIPKSLVYSHVLDVFEDSHEKGVQEDGSWEWRTWEGGCVDYLWRHKDGQWFASEERFDQ